MNRQILKKKYRDPLRQHVVCEKKLSHNLGSIVTKL